MLRTHATLPQASLLKSRPKTWGAYHPYYPWRHMESPLEREAQQNPALRKTESPPKLLNTQLHTTYCTSTNKFWQRSQSPKAFVTAFVLFSYLSLAHAASSRDPIASCHDKTSNWSPKPMEYFFGPLIGNFLCLDPGFFLRGDDC